MLLPFLLPPAFSPSTGSRAGAVRAGVQVEIVSLIWMVVEAVVAIAAGVLAGSALLMAFGLDSVIELITGGALLWRLLCEAHGKSLERVVRAERWAAWVTGTALALLCVYVLVTALATLLVRAHPDTSLLGLALAGASLLIMPVLTWRKRRIAARIDSAALRGDAACSSTCAYLAGTLLIGLAVQALTGWWWAQSVAALALLYWLQSEAREALAAARAGRGGCGCCHDASDG